MLQAQIRSIIYFLHPRDRGEEIFGGSRMDPRIFDESSSYLCMGLKFKKSRRKTLFLFKHNLDAEENKKNATKKNGFGSSVKVKEGTPKARLITTVSLLA